jgi:lipopolysaccharide transport system ATP-binding protein
MSAAIRVDNLSKQYKIGMANLSLREHITNVMTLKFLRAKSQPEEILWALRNVSLSIEHGETVGIVGRNGAGKSTLLKVLSKITYPTSGSMSISGRVISLLEVGTGFHEELTGRENIYLNGSILGMTKKEVKGKLDAIVEFSGVEQFIDTPIKRYSSGMRLRLGFAVAAHLDPDILIVDEVLAVGDAQFQKKCLDTIQKLRASARTILFVSHNLSAVENLCERCIWINHGEVHMDGDTATVLRDYQGSMRETSVIDRDLEGAKTRRGSGQIRFTSLEFLSPEGVSQKVIRAGDPVVMRFHYKVHEPVTFPSIGFRMYTESGTLVTDTSTSHHGIYIPSVEHGEGYLDLDIACLNLLAAKYTISLWVTDQHGTVVYDNIENAVTFEVDTANLYKSNLVIDSRFGIVYFPQKWDLKGMSGRTQEPPSESSSLTESLARDDK